MKSSQLQLRITAGDKRKLQKAARGLGKSVSEFVLARALRGLSESERFDGLIGTLNGKDLDPYALAEMNDLLSRLTLSELSILLELPRVLGKTPLHQNYVAAMLEQTCRNKELPIPKWLAEISPLATPWFASSLTSLRGHLLINAPVSFRRRNLFVDTSVGGRV